jgi:hypothetical protein
MKKLTAFETELLKKAFVILNKDMTYEQEEEIIKAAGASVTDLVDLATKLEG